LSGYGLKWSTGENSILLVSVGTGAADPKVRYSQIAAAGAFQSLLSLMNDVASLQEAMLQWMSRSATARSIDRELGTLEGDVIGGTPLLTYLRYDGDLGAHLAAMDAPENMAALHALGAACGEAKVRGEHFPGAFDLS